MDPSSAGSTLRSPAVAPPIGPGAYERAVLAFRADPSLKTFVEKNYLDEDLDRALSRYVASKEFSRVCSILEPVLSARHAILDLGVGRGLTSLALAGRGARLTAVESDPSKVVGVSALVELRKSGPAAMRTARADVLKLPFSDGAFPAAFCRSVLHHVESLEAGLREIGRVLQPGGVFLACNEHILSFLSRGVRFRAAHPAVRFGVDERAYSAWRYWLGLRRAGFDRVWFFGHPLALDEFVEATASNPMRARLVSLPLIGPALARLLHSAHVIVRRHVFVCEAAVPAISIVALKKGEAQHGLNSDFRRSIETAVKWTCSQR